MNFFIIIGCFLIYLHPHIAQSYQRQNQAPSFFMPHQETAITSEKLPPIQKINQVKNQTHNTPDAQYDIKYVLVNGVYVPTFIKRKKVVQHTENAVIDNQPNIKRKKAETLPENNSNNLQEQLPVAEQLPTVEQMIIEEPIEQPIGNEKFEKPSTTPASQKADVQNNNYVELPFDATIDNNLPSYRNIFSQYLNDTLTFQKENMFPENEALSQSLSKASSDKEITIFRGIVKPSLK